MTEQDAFVRRICEQPGEDTHRLVYADWLDENGQPGRAEFVRDTEGAWPFVYFLRDELLRTLPRESCVSGYGRSYHGGGPPYFRFGVPGGIGCTADFLFRRGFVDEIRLPLSAFTETVARELFGRMPLTWVVLTCREPEAGLRWCSDRLREPIDPYDASELPVDIWSLLKNHWNPRRAAGGLASPGDRLQYKVYDSTAEALDALSRACVDWARDLAGLPPLAWPEPAERSVV